MNTKFKKHPIDEGIEKRDDLYYFSEQIRCLQVHFKIIGIAVILKVFMKSKMVSCKLKIFWTNGELSFISKFKEGLAHGYNHGYHKNGKLWFSNHYENGELDGLSENFDEDGGLLTREVFKRGKRVN